MEGIDNFETSTKILLPEIENRFERSRSVSKELLIGLQKAEKVINSKREFADHLKTELHNLRGERDRLEEKSKSFDFARNKLLRDNVSRLQLAKAGMDERLAEIQQQEIFCSNDFCSQLADISRRFMDGPKKYGTSTLEGTQAEVESLLKEIQLDIAAKTAALKKIEEMGYVFSDVPGGIENNMKPGSELAKTRKMTNNLRSLRNIVEEAECANNELVKIAEEKQEQLEALAAELTQLKEDNE